MKNYNWPLSGADTGFYTTPSLPGIAAGAPASEEEEGREALTREDIAEIVAQSLSSLRVYVVESDITDAQNSVRAVVEQSII